MSAGDCLISPPIRIQQSYPATGSNMTMPPCASPETNLPSVCDSITVNVYTRKWFLGGRDKFLASRKIPYDYEDSLRVLTNSNSGRFPGEHIKFGVRTIFDDHQSTDLWYPVKKKNRNNFLLGFGGGHLSRSKGDWKINPHPTQINNDEVKLFARLGKDSAIGDTLRLLLDYKAFFQCGISSSGDGDALNVTVDAFYDSIISAELLKVEVNDVATQRTYHYLVNTSGGSININSAGADGANGDNGLSGADGRNGADGATSQVAQTVTNADGTTTTTYLDVQGPGGDGENGGPGGDGGSGGSGSNGGSGAPPGRGGLKGSDGANGSRGISGTRGFVRYIAL